MAGAATDNATGLTITTGISYLITFGQCSYDYCQDGIIFFFFFFFSFFIPGSVGVRRNLFSFNLFFFFFF